MKRCNQMVELGRRQFLRGGATAVVTTAAAGALVAGKAEATPALARVNYPSQRLANVKDLKVDQPVEMTYPDKDSPGALIKLGHRVEGGVGPEGDIVAFSTLCPHKGFPLNYVAADKSFNSRATTPASTLRKAARKSSGTPPRTWRSSSCGSNPMAISTPRPSMS